MTTAVPSAGALVGLTGDAWLGIIGLLVGALGIAVSAGLYWQGGGRKPRVAIALEPAHVKEEDTVLRLGRLSSDRESARVFVLEISSRGPRDIEVDDALDELIKALRPSFRLKDGYSVANIHQRWYVELPDTPRGRNPNHDVRMAGFRGDDDGEARRRVSVHVHRLNSKQTIRLYFAVLADQRSGARFHIGQGSIVESYFHGWIRDVDVTFRKKSAVWGRPSQDALAPNNRDSDK